MKFLVLIQARCGSSRLPNKVMKKISGKKDLEWVLERVKRSKKVYRAHECGLHAAAIQYF